MWVYSRLKLKYRSHCPTKVVFSHLWRDVTLAIVKALFGCSISVKYWKLTLAHLRYGDEMGPLFGWGD
jgi:hypothetical protein